MAKLPAKVAEFLSGKRYAVTGVSRTPTHFANAIYRRLLASGFEVLPVNPAAAEVEGVRCWPDLVSIPGAVDGVVIASHPRTGPALVRQCAEKGIRRVWFHRSFGEGSVSKEAVAECKARGIDCLVGGCPLMYCEPVDAGHRCILSLLRFFGRTPG
jgi:predicted CoA-binding protein